MYKRRLSLWLRKREQFILTPFSVYFIFIMYVCVYVFIYRAEIWEWKPGAPNRIPLGDRPVHHLVGDFSNSFCFVGTRGAENSCLNRACHRHSLAKAACGSPQGLWAEQEAWKEHHSP